MQVDLAKRVDAAVEGEFGSPRWFSVATATFESLVQRGDRDVRVADQHGAGKTTAMNALHARFLDTLTIPLVFLASIPIAYAFGADWGRYTWALLIVILPLSGAWATRRVARIVAKDKARRAASPTTTPVAADSAGYCRSGQEH